MVATFGSVLSQDLTLDCQFTVSVYNEYACILSGIDVPDPSQNVTFGGNHVENRTNEDVEVVIIFFSNTPFIIPEIFTTFPNINELDIEFSGLESINIPNNTKLIWLDIFGNEVTSVESDSLKTQPELTFCFLSYNYISAIAEDAFEGISNAILLEIIENEIEQIEPETFHPLINAVVIDLEGNLLRRVDDFFSRNRMLTNLYLEYNQIEEIHPRFTANLDNLRVVYLNGNECVSRYFYLYGELELTIMNVMLRDCFLNYNGTVSEGKSIGMEFRGPLRIFDEFNNLIGSV